MNRTIAFLALSLALTWTSSALAGGNAEAGKELAKPCAACHGADGNPTDPQYPRLAGQYRDYIEHSLQQYKDEKRKNAIMAGFAKPLTSQNMADLAAYFSALPGKLEDLSQLHNAK